MADFRILYQSARAHLDGRDMYNLPSELKPSRDQTVRMVTPVNLNPPHFHVVLLPLARLPAALALTLWALASLLCFGCSIYLIARELSLKPSCAEYWRGAAWLLALASMGAVLGTAQVSFVLMPALTLAWIAARRGQWSRTGIYLGLAMSVKLFLLIFIPYFLFTRRLRAATISCTVASACFASGVLIFGPDSYWTWLHQLGSVNWAWLPLNASLLGILKRSLSETLFFTPLLAAPELILPLWLPVAATVGVLSLVAAVLDRTPSSVDRAFVLLILAALLISPLGWIYYLWLGIGPAAGLGLQWWRSACSDRSNQTTTAAHWRRRFLILAIPGLVWPAFATFVFQPHAWATVLLASVYFWSTAALWCAILADWWALNPRIARVAELPPTRQQSVITPATSCIPPRMWLP